MLTNPRDRAWVEVQADALLRNASTLQQVVGPGSQLIPMVKADAYGVGRSQAVQTLETTNPWGFGVATLDEGLELQRLGVIYPILVVSPLPPASTEAAVEAGLQLGISNPETLSLVTDAAERIGRAAEIHLSLIHI